MDVVTIEWLDQWFDRQIGDWVDAKKERRKDGNRKRDKN
jgi:hypothetical protein